MPSLHRPAVLLFCLLLAAPLHAQIKPINPESEAEAKARLDRRTAGLTIGQWDLRGIEPAAGVEVSTMPMITGFMRKGLDARLALENSIGVWRRVQPTASEEVRSWVVAQTTALRFFPDFGGERTYQGPSYDLGLTYKFRYR